MTQLYERQERMRKELEEQERMLEMKRRQLEEERRRFDEEQQKVRQSTNNDNNSNRNKVHEISQLSKLFSSYLLVCLGGGVLSYFLSSFVLLPHTQGEVTQKLTCASDSASLSCCAAYKPGKEAIRQCSMPCHVMSCHVMSCHVMSCHVMYVYAVLAKSDRRTAPAPFTFPPSLRLNPTTSCASGANAGENPSVPADNCASSQRFIVHSV